MTEPIIVTLTSYGNRINNLPSVIGSILGQTVRPDSIVINLAFNESIPDDINEFLTLHNVEIYRVPDTKVYKKLIPTLERYPDACVISIDDDFIYPSVMIAEFLNLHKAYPDFPISGNKVIYFGMQCHCGCASLVKSSYFNDYLSNVDNDIINNCPSDDILYTFFATKSGHPYIYTDNEYFTNMQSYGVDDNSTGYSYVTGGEAAIIKTYNYLVDRFGPIDDIISLYIHNDSIAKVLASIQKYTIWEREQLIRSSHSYKLGRALLRPFKLFKKK